MFQVLRGNIASRTTVQNQAFPCGILSKKIMHESKYSGSDYFYVLWLCVKGSSKYSGSEYFIFLFVNQLSQGYCLGLGLGLGLGLRVDASKYSGSEYFILLFVNQVEWIFSVDLFVVMEKFVLRDAYDLLLKKHSQAVPAQFVLKMTLL